MSGHPGFEEWVLPVSTDIFEEGRQAIQEQREAEQHAKDLRDQRDASYARWEALKRQFEAGRYGFSDERTSLTDEQREILQEAADKANRLTLKYEKAAKHAEEIRRRNQRRFRIVKLADPRTVFGTGVQPDDGGGEDE